MGAKPSSKQHGQAQPVKMPQLPALPPQPPYSGPPVLYKHVTINATIDMNAKFSFTTPNVSVSATNIDSYYSMLASMYGQGFRMLVFVSLPGSTRSYGLSNIGAAQSTVKFQGIFRQQFPDEMGQQWELRVEKSMLVNQMFYQWNGVMTLSSNTGTQSISQSHHVIQTIQNVTQNGGRFLSVEMTGMGGQQVEIQRQMMQQRQMHPMTGGVMPAMEVPIDVFYEIPLHPTSERYVYQIVPCPMDSVFQQDFPHGRFNSTMNWQGVMQQYLGSGWKLVEIFEDYTASTQTAMQGFSANISIRKNCLWIFEKPVSRLNDNTPYYAGTMAEHWFRTKTQIHGIGFGGASVDVQTDWEPLLDHMGQYGWQVVRILSTPDTVMQGTFSMAIQTRQMIFFQKRLLDDSGRSLEDLNQKPFGVDAPSVTASADAMPPGYDQLYPDVEKS